MHAIPHAILACLLLSGCHRAPVHQGAESPAPAAATVRALPDPSVPAESLGIRLPPPPPALHLRGIAGTCYAPVPPTTWSVPMQPRMREFLPEALELYETPTSGPLAGTPPAEPKLGLIALGPYFQPAAWYRGRDSLYILQRGIDTSQWIALAVAGDTVRGVGRYRSSRGELTSWPIVAVQISCPKR